MHFIGNKRAVKILEKQRKSGRLAQSYLFCGPENVGKKTLAMQMALEVTNGEEGKINPDVFLIEPEIQEKKGISKILDIKIEKIRELKRRISLHSQGNGQRFFVIDGADKLTKSAQNALLKILEEPNEKAVIILISENEKKLLPTILSRCQKIKFNLVSDEDLQEIISENISNKEAVIFWALNRPGLAYCLLENPEEMKFRKEVFEDFKLLFSGNMEEKMSLAERISKDETNLLKKLELWTVLLRKAMLGASEKIKISPVRSFRLIEKIIGGIATIKESNASARLVLENIFLEF